MRLLSRPFVLSNKEARGDLNAGTPRTVGLRSAAKDLEARIAPEPEMSCSVEDGVENVPLVTGKCWSAAITLR